jgi:hypothetical protein
LCIAQQGEFKNTIKQNLGESMSKTFYKKNEGGGGGGPVIYPLRFVLIAFLGVSLHEELKHTYKCLKKNET